ncbi:MAG: DUF11 domain-containing protein [Anaerolineae bacterium]|nr:DUF11 domain-containing protein [Anaerolineae bacterium]
MSNHFWLKSPVPRRQSTSDPRQNDSGAQNPPILPGVRRRRTPHLKKPSLNPSQREGLKLFLISMLVGLMSLAGLIYRAGMVPAQAAGQLLEPGRPAPTAPFNAIQAQAQITAQETITPLDVVVVFDVSASMEDQTICHDCWVRTSYSPDWPNNGYFNPLPYWEKWKYEASGGPAATGNQSIPLSALCTVYPPQPFITNTFQYLTLEAELYSAITGDWGLDARVPGNGFWSIQRGSKGNIGMPGEPNELKNAAGQPTYQSSNVCRPNVAGGQIDCTVGNGIGLNGDNVCDSADGGVAIDCSAFIAARPMANYGQMPGAIPSLIGAAYNGNCFINSGGTGSTGGDCWSNNPFNTLPGLEKGPSTVPYVEYDFTPTWTQTTSIWLRVIGGGDEAYTWAGPSPDQIQPDLNGGGVANNITPWRKVIYWQVGTGTIFQRKDNLNDDYSNSPTENYTSNNSSHVQKYDTWNANRAIPGYWRWIKLGSTTTTSGTQSILRLYAGSAGYMVDKIVFTNDPNGNTPQGGAKITNATDIPAALRRTVSGTIQTTGFDSTNKTTVDNAWRDSLGPPASFGSATREACNKCNPAYGYTVSAMDCTCRKNGGETGYGTGMGCTYVPNITPTNQLQEQVQTGLYSGNQPMRSAQESVKHLAGQLNPMYDQLGFVAFSNNTANTNDRRAKLQCLVWALTQLGNPARCYDPGLGTPLGYTNVLSAVEKQWPDSSTNTSLGLREGLEELGIMTPGNPTPVNSGNCTATANDGNTCDRRGPARRMIILMTDGSPNQNTNGTSVPSADRSPCAPGSGRPDVWDGILGTEDPDFECAAYYAYLAAQNNILVYTVGIGAGVNHDLLNTVATGIDPRGAQPDVKMFDAQCGQYFAAAKPSDLNLIVEQVLAHARTCQLPPPNLTLTKMDTPDPVLASQRVTYTIAVTNHGPFAAPGIVVTDFLDSNVTLLFGYPSISYKAGVITGSAEFIPEGQALYWTVVVSAGNVPSGTVLSNIASVSTSRGVSHTVIATTTVVTALPPPLPTPLLTLLKSDSPEHVAPGEILTYTLTLANNGSAAATGVVITDALSSNMNFISASNNAISDSDVVTWNVGLLPLGQALTRTLVVTVSNLSSGAILTNTAWVTSNEDVNHSSIATTTILNSEQVWAFNYILSPGGDLFVHLENHYNPAGPYDIYLSDGVTVYRICDSVNTSPGTHVGEFTCPLPGTILPGLYDLYSTLTGNTNPLAFAPQKVEVIIDPVVPSSVTISGPTTGGLNTVYTFTATTSPATATLPLTYHWQASGQSPVTHTGGLSDTASFAWNVTGPQVITVTATNGGGTAMDTHTTTILPAVCANPLAETSFESVPLTKWFGAGSNGVFQTVSSHTGNSALLADTSRPGPNNPFFYQRFTVPTGLDSGTTTVKLGLFKNVEQEMDGPNPNDQFSVVLATTPGLSSALTIPTVVASGDQGTIGYNPANWQELNVLLSPASGINLADYAGQDLYLYFYNNSNQTVGCPPSNCQNTSFYFDDISLTFCVPVVPVQTTAPNQVQPGGAFTYTITVANTGAAAATGVVVSDILDNRVSFVAASDNGQHQNGIVTWNVGGLPAGQAITRTLAVTVGNVVSGTILSNTVRVTSTEGISSSRIITTTVFNPATPPGSTYLPVILKQ